MLNVALIGYGYWGAKLARNFQNSEFFNLVFISDLKSKNLSLAKKNYPLIKTSSNYKVAIKDSAIDLVIISSPTITHFKICKYALENNKHTMTFIAMHRTWKCRSRVHRARRQRSFPGTLMSLSLISMHVQGVATNPDDPQ